MSEPITRRCKGCDRMLTFVSTSEGKIIPLDRTAPVYEIVRDLEGRMVAVRTGDSFGVSHFATCAKANDFSGSKKGGPR